MTRSSLEKLCAKKFVLIFRPPISPVIGGQMVFLLQRLNLACVEYILVVVENLFRCDWRAEGSCGGRLNLACAGYISVVVEKLISL